MDEGCVHGTKLKIMRTKVSVLMRLQPEHQVGGEAMTTSALHVLPTPIRRAHSPPLPTASVKISEKHKD